MLSAGAALFGVREWRAVHTPYELDYGEGILMWQAENVTRPATAFRPLEQFPHLAFMYTPVYHLAAHGVKALTGDMLAAGRWVSFASALGIFLVLLLQTRSAIPGPPSWGPACAAPLLCANLNTMSWAKFMRVDLLALLLTFLGLWLFQTGRDRPWMRYLAFSLFVLAVFTKQTQIAAPAACLVLTMWRKPWEAARLLGFAVGLGAAALGVFAWLTHGVALTHWFAYNKNPFSLINMFGILQINLAQAAPLAGVALLVPAAGAIRVWRYRPAGRAAAWVDESQTRRALALASLHLVFALGVALTCGKRGSNYNYFLEWNIACCVPAAVVLAMLLARWNPLRTTVAQTAILLVLLLTATNGVAGLAQDVVKHDDSGQRREFEAAVDELRATAGPVYSEDMTVLMKSGKALAAEPAIITVLAQTGAWDERPFTDRIRARYFDAIVVTTAVTNQNRYTVGVARAIQDTYRPGKAIGGYTFWVPKR